MHDLHHALRHPDKSIFNSLLIINDHQRRLLEKTLNFRGGVSVIVRNSAEIKHRVTFLPHTGGISQYQAQGTPNVSG